MRPDCIIVIPTYNEAENIAGLIQQIISEPRFSVLVVDDNSPDRTARIVQEIASQYEQVKLLSRPKKEGYGVACIAGFERALSEGADFVFQMDADFSHNPVYLPGLLAAVETDCDLAIGSRYVEGGSTTDWGLMRRALSKFANFYSRNILRMPVNDCTSGFRCYRRAVLEKIGLNSIFSNGYSFLVELTFRTLLNKYRIVEIPIIFPDRNVGRSKMRKRDVLEAIIAVWRLRFSYGRIQKRANQH
jgi:dolichol-phosphate mannosyltransferase